MGKSIRVTTKKRRGRPATTGKGVQIGERWHKPELEAIDQWIAAKGEKMTRGEAVRRLVELGLARGRPTQPSSANKAERAKHLAAKAIDDLVHSEAHPEEKAHRKRRLLKGPEEFREARLDHKRKT